jgi:hypothetical protein
LVGYLVKTVYKPVNVEPAPLPSEINADEILKTLIPSFTSDMESATVETTPTISMTFTNSDYDPLSLFEEL